MILHDSLLACEIYMVRTIAFKKIMEYEKADMQFFRFF